MNTLNIRLIGLAIALPLIAIQIAGAEDLKVTATKKLSEVKKSSDQSMIKTARYIQINQQGIEAQVESLASIQKKMSDLKKDESVPAVRRAAMQKQYFAQKESLVVEILKSLDDASAEIERLGSGLQDSLGEIGVAESYMDRYLAEDSKLSNLKSSGRATFSKLDKLQLEWESLDLSDPKRKDLRSELRTSKKELNKLGQEVMQRSRVSQFLSKMADFSEMYKEQISNRQEQIYNVVDGFDFIKITYENELEMIKLQREAADLTSMPEGLGDIANTLKMLESVGSQLSSSELLLPPVPDGSEAINVPSFGLDMNQLRELFSE